ncbi:MAG: hypothetical protein A3J62_02650 [Candidatus Buchananbacteria bacterium RIFCSPHIGHO2_02_FULL_38_8]|uniref:Metallo-beta-lactamase domain-containing protein n=1 Tax=Candidatus Buchananbacteria bacterium RIFCSPHIGHO2_02_FULL_38_8 TaxID=1797538 RepID=A0A1G1Y641_9BACT|nr:MAG: hypothetical protein A3J62_02650 [Candidatus Buchananbacteria bacterium RIFCSPHIGHO2_02_FULL_38_8]
MRAKRVIIIFYLLIFLSFLLILLLFLGLQKSSFQFCVFDVGQGDAILTRTARGQNILIDGGSDNTVIYKLGEYLPFYERKIDLVILTHPHADHVTGLVEVLKRYKVKNIFLTGVIYNESGYQAFINLIRQEDINFKIIDEPQRVILDHETELIILFPDQSFLDQEVKNLNNTSIVAKLIYQNNLIILTGDFEHEEELVSGNWGLLADILKVGHHGSDTANSLEFLAAVKPAWAIISVGENNKFGHPHQQTIDYLSRLGSKILRTDQDGDVCFRLDGENMVLKNN